MNELTVRGTERKYLISGHWNRVAMRSALNDILKEIKIKQKSEFIYKYELTDQHKIKKVIYKRYIDTYDIGVSIISRPQTLFDNLKLIQTIYLH